MGAKTNVRRFCVLGALLLALGVTAAAQEQNREWFSYVQQAEGEAAIIQHLSWDPEAYARRYEITVAQDQNGIYAEIFRESTEAAFIEVSLGPGKYRYRIQVYDLLNHPRGNPAWEYFEVMSALQPEIQSASPEAFFPEDNAEWTVTLTGSNFAEGAEIFLRERDGKTLDIIPRSVTTEDGGESLILTFDAEQLSAGDYDVYIKNPGGLAASAKNIKVASPGKHIDTLIAAGYGPIIPLYGKFFTGVFNKPVDLLGFYARIGAVPVKQRWGNFGAETELFWNYLDNSGDEYSASSHVAGGHINLLYQYWPTDRVIALNVRLGAGITAILDYHYHDGYGDMSAFYSYYISAGAGASIQWFIRRPFFLEFGMEFNHFFTTKDATQPGFIRPVLGGGLQF
ncbi:MAG: hypothetical protein LBN21_10795 [Treponema sp.]|jgi:hypothetical protein|nr:hypothetical protein [Treponema sp.]